MMRLCGSFDQIASNAKFTFHMPRPYLTLPCAGSLHLQIPHITTHSRKVEKSGNGYLQEYESMLPDDGTIAKRAYIIMRVILATCEGVHPELTSVSNTTKLMQTS